MDGIADYIKWLGRFSFSELPLCEIDAFVMCVISYFDLTPVVSRADAPLAIRGCRDAMERGELKLQITGGDMGNSDIFRAAIESRRFGELIITDYADILRPEVPLQFAAVTLTYEDDFSFIAYRGTDETIAGWKEDFMISFTRTEAQVMAAEYAQDIIRPGRRWYIGGHSKGGNQALYAACMLSQEAIDQVERVFILDGPGLCPEVMDTSLVERINAKAIRIIPEFSVVGKLFEPDITDTRIIRSSASGILQHSLATWGVEYGQIAAAPENDHRSLLLMQILNRWIEHMGQEERKTLGDDLFGALAAGGAVTLSEVAGGGPEGFEAVLLKMFRASGVTKKIMRDLPVQAAAILWKQVQSLGAPKEVEEL